MSVRSRIQSFLLLTSILISPFISSISADAAIVCDTANGFSWDGTNCTRTETVNKICHPNRGYNSATTNSATHSLNTSTIECEFLVASPQIIQDATQNTQPPADLDYFEINGQGYLAASYSNADVVVYEWDSSGINTTPFQTFVATGQGNANITIYEDDLGVTHAITSAGWSGDFLVHNWIDGTGFVYDYTITIPNSPSSPHIYQRKTSNVKYVNTGNGEFLFLGLDMLTYNTTTSQWEFDSTIPETLSYYMANEYVEIDGDHFMFFNASSFNPGSGCVCSSPIAYLYDGTNWVFEKEFTEFFNVPLGQTPRMAFNDYTSLTPGQMNLTFYGSNAVVQYPYGKALYFSPDSTRAFVWDGADFQVLTDDQSEYNPFAESFSNPTTSNRTGSFEAKSEILDDQVFTAYSRTFSQVCVSVPRIQYTVSSLTNYPCVSIPNGSTIPNTGTIPNKLEIINDGNNLYSIHRYSYSGQAGIATTQLTDTQSYPAFCPTGGYTDDGPTEPTCSQTTLQSGGEYYEVEYSDFDSVVCTPLSLEKTDTSDCVINLSYSNFGFPVQLPTGGDVTASINTATGNSDPCILTTPTELTCNNIPATGSDLGGQDIRLTFPSQTPQNIETANILSTPTISSLSHTQSTILGGDRITIFGSEFFDPVTITIDGQACTNVIFISENEISCEVPVGTAGIVTLEISNSDGQSATTNFEYIDDDNDSIEKSQEQQAPNSGDGNDDGVQDYLQDDVTSLPISGGGMITIELDGQCNSSQSMFLDTEEAQDFVDNEYDFKNGLVGYNINCPTGQTEITQYWYGLDTSQDYVYRKYGPIVPGNSQKEWYTFDQANITVENVAGQDVVVVRFTLADGVFGDDTGVDGVIVDPGGLATITQAENTDTGNGLIRTGGYGAYEKKQ